MSNCRKISNLLSAELHTDISITTDYTKGKAYFNINNKETDISFDLSVLYDCDYLKIVDMLIPQLQKIIRE
jgi:hypothetical protein